uniref:Uncharacterized protein n=1 Tax=Acrobeloides nanus TaxID=290746 RepID=A0A914CX53_9BILA
MDQYLTSLIPAASLNFTPKWNSETAIDWCSCAKGYSDTFLAGFLWLDKLGLSALYGMEMVLRQCLYGAYFGILNHENKPRNDYWLSFLYKKLVGTQVYGVSFNLVEPKLRLYAASSRK